jgi:tRNA (adenine57-N1/adenine58-N1)-methyltransferase
MVLLLDRKGRRHLVRLAAEGAFHSHAGLLPHSGIIGRPEGSRLRTAHGWEVLVLRPTLAEYVRKMPRQATIIYPKDTGAILVYGDVYPGATVVEAGAGSGALSLALLQAVGEGGRVISYEIRPEAGAQATRNVTAFAPELLPRWTLHLADVSQGIQEENVDRLILDLPEPWTVTPAAAAALRDGGIFLSYVPTTLQVHQTVLALQEGHVFGLVETMEVLVRPWDVSQRSVRPAHRMVAHTGFLIVARKLQPGADFPPTRRKEEF